MPRLRGAFRTLKGRSPDDPVKQKVHLERLSQAFADLRRMTKISCWHARQAENISMWERYLHGTPGVAVASTVSALKCSLQPFRLQPHYGEEPIAVGAVRYLDYAGEDMKDRSMLAVFFHKRAEFPDEAEVRAVLSLRMAAEFAVPIPDDGVVVAVDPPTLLQPVRAWPTASSADVTALRTATEAAGVRCPVLASSLARPPVY